MKPTFILILLLLISCKSDPKTEPISPEYEVEMSNHYNKLNLGRTNYLELIGLFKLTEGENSFGKAKGNTFTINAEVAEQIGSLTNNDSILKIKINNAINVTLNNKENVIEKILVLDEFGSSVKFYHNSIYWQVITRSGELYLRIWDKNNPYVKLFNGFKKFPLNKDFIIEGNFEYYETKKNEEIKTQLGVNTTTQFIGKVSFDFKGQIQTLDVGGNGFTMVSDATSGTETYGGGRYFYLDLPKENGVVNLDFNKLYNPPCAFSDFTTCPLPPRQNVLPLKIEAGEKYEKNK